MIKKYLTFVNESIDNNEIVVNVKKHITKNNDYTYNDSDWDINPFHEFDELNNYLRGKEVFFVASKIHHNDYDNFHGEIGVYHRLTQYKNNIYIHFYKKGKKHPLSGILVSDYIVVIEKKKMGDLYVGDKVWYHLGVKHHDWLNCEVVAFDHMKGKVFIVDWISDSTYPYTFWVDPKKLHKIKPINLND